MRVPIFFCFDCKVWHAPGRGNHTAAGQAILDKRYGSKPKTAPNKYVRKVVPPPSNRSRCQYCDREGHLEEKCFKKQRDQKRVKEEMHSQEQDPFASSDPPAQKLTLNKCHQIQQDTQIAALALKLSQKHLAQAEGNNCLELTASATFLCNPCASRVKTTINK